jgi:hypothetical protein
LYLKENLPVPNLPLKYENIPFYLIKLPNKNDSNDFIQEIHWWVKV